MCGEKQKKGGLYGCRNGGAHVSNVLGCICKDEVGSITEVEGNINSAKCVDILDPIALITCLICLGRD
jgi:hypothetical protein